MWGRGDCFPCANEGRGDCSKSCAGYKLERQDFPKFKISAVYNGETGRNAYSRGLEQLAGFPKQKRRQSIMKTLFTAAQWTRSSI